MSGPGDLVRRMQSLDRDVLASISTLPSGMHGGSTMKPSTTNPSCVSGYIASLGAYVSPQTLAGGGKEPRVSYS